MFSIGFYWTALSIIAQLAFAVPSAYASQSDSKDPETLSYDHALIWALEHSLELKIAELEVEANQAEERQAFCWPNPELSIEYETPCEITCGVSQVFELGGKCQATRQMLRAHTIESMWDLEIAKLETAHILTEAFLEAYLYQEKWNLTQQHLQLAEESLSCIQEKISQGKLPPIEKNKHDLKCFQQRAMASKMHNQVQAAKKKLAFLCGRPEVESLKLTYKFEDLQPVPELSVLEQQLKTSPGWSKSEVYTVIARADTRLEEKLSYPDLEVSAGVTSNDEEGIANAFFVEFSIPLPLFDRNHGHIAKAYLKEAQADYLKEKMQRELLLNLQHSYSSWKFAYDIAKEAQSIAYSASKQTLQGIQEGFAQGKYDKSELLEAQQAALEAQEEYLDALADYHQKKSETLHLVGQIFRCHYESKNQ